MVTFTYIKTLNTDKNSIFYSLININNEIMGFGRQLTFTGVRLNDYIKKIKLDNNFNIIENDISVFRGEDPRTFIHNKVLYGLDNYFNDMYLIDYEKNKYLKIKIDGKNISFISHNNHLYFIHFMKPFVLYELNIENGNVIKISTEDNGEHNHEYRGGTPGYKTTNNNEYYGFGHRTYYKRSEPNQEVLMSDLTTQAPSEGYLIHDIFMWIVNFNDELPKIQIFDVIQPDNSKNICDPTSVIELNNKKYLVTAESDNGWFTEQCYNTNIYEIQDE